MGARGYGDLDEVDNQIKSLRNELRNTQQAVRELSKIASERYEQGRKEGWNRALKAAAQLNAPDLILALVLP